MVPKYQEDEFEWGSTFAMDPKRKTLSDAEYEAIIIVMNETFIRERITELRIQKNISEYKMSLDLGHSKSYIQSISSGKALPSMSEFLYICEYLGITPKEFFDVNNSEVLKLHQLFISAKELPNEDLDALIYLANRLKNRAGK